MQMNHEVTCNNECLS